MIYTVDSPYYKSFLNSGKMKKPTNEEVCDALRDIKEKVIL